MKNSLDNLKRHTPQKWEFYAWWNVLATHFKIGHFWKCFFFLHSVSFFLQMNAHWMLYIKFLHEKVGPNRSKFSLFPWFSLWYIVGLVMLFWNFALKKLLPLRVFPNSEILFKSVVFIWNKWLQIAPLLIIFVDILPKKSAVSFAEIFY